ncbi:hypothetical protein XELAEV_18046970mg [Xenopus laevis]|uniref:Uncharacterized protein n=1 Tax=Xenopus laevis TaxID=8355 RepID=A0A974H1F9_XENLA|nr:hypothetical protein XELAEV_18046970mg [Xenopus laevis]
MLSGRLLFFLLNIKEKFTLRLLLGNLRSVPLAVNTMLMDPLGIPYPFHEVLHEQKGTEVNHNLIGNCFKWTRLGLQPMSIIDQVIRV